MMAHRREWLLWNTELGQFMAHAVIPGANGRRHGVGFEDAEVKAEIFFGDAAVKIAVEATNDLVAAGNRRAALLNRPNDLYTRALGDAVRRRTRQGSAILKQQG
jgi:hypothetical protein